MSPRVASKDKGALPKTEVVAGTLGYYGADEYTLSQLAQGYCDLVIGLKDAPITTALKNRGTMDWVNTRQQKEIIELPGRFYNGLSDAFYRGTFPNILIFAQDPEHLDAFMDDVLDHIEKMVSLGFFFQFANPAEMLLPNIVIASNGIFFHAIQRQLQRMMEGLKVIDQEIKNAIFGKFMRGILSDYNPLRPYVSGSEVPTYKPIGLKIAGGSRTNRISVQTVLEAHHQCPVLAPQMNGMIEALELENALKRLTQAILPALVAGGAIPKKSLEKEQKVWLNRILDIGQQRKVFHEDYGFDFLAEEDSPVAPRLGQGDLLIVNGLHEYNKQAGFKKEEEHWDSLKKLVYQQLSG